MHLKQVTGPVSKLRVSLKWVVSTPLFLNVQIACYCPRLIGADKSEIPGMEGQENDHNGSKSFPLFPDCFDHLSFTLQFYSERNMRNSPEDGGHCC